MDDFQAILERIRNNDPTLTISNMLNYEIDNEKAKTLADALKENTTLKSLNLGVNPIADEGVKYIADALMVNKDLESLDITDIRITDEGFKDIASALKVNASLKSLRVACNIITDEGAKDIADALEVNSGLINLNLDDEQYNQISQEYYKKISDLINENISVSSISHKILSNFQASQNLAFDDKELKLINTSPRACKKIFTQLLDKSKTKDGDRFDGNKFVNEMKGFKAGLTILLNCKDSEVFKSLNNSLTVNDLFKGLGVMKDKKSETNFYAEVFDGEWGSKNIKSL